MSLKYIKNPVKIPKQFKDCTDYSRNSIPVFYSKKKNAPKILFILDYFPSEDINSTRFLSGATGEVLKTLIEKANRLYYSGYGLEDINWTAISFNAFKTAHLGDENKEIAIEIFKERVNKTIVQYKPDVVITFGNTPFKNHLGSSILLRIDNNIQHTYGQLFDIEVTYKKETYKTKICHNLSLDIITNAGSSDGGPYLLGYMARCLSNGIRGKLRYSIPRNPKYKIVYINTINKFNKLLRKMHSEKLSSIDTETNNLYRVQNKVLLFQIAFDTNVAYIVPIDHKDTPFLSKELKYIKEKLARYFESKREGVHVFTNAQFDLNVMRSQFGIRYYSKKVWDIFAGEFILDENMKFLSDVNGGYYYSLGNICMQYGSNIYHIIEFGKKKRATIKDVSLTEDVLEYCALDVIMPLYIREQQLRRAKDLHYEKYVSMVSEQQSDMIHTYSTMESRGVPTDVDYLFYLRHPKSPIRQEMEKVKNTLYETEGAKVANSIILSNTGTPKIGLFGKVDRFTFDISKEEHKQILFFKALKLKPLSTGKKGIPKIDKQFQNTYSDIPEVNLYTQLGKVKKLYGSYVKQFIKYWSTSEDFKGDKRIRPNFNYLAVVTGRGSENSPSLQQIPSRSELGKHIKRLFIAPKGQLVLKIDYSAHEVRCWSIITGDKKIADVFKVGYDLRKEYKYNPSEDLKKEIELKGDVHKINAAYFFKLDIKDVVKEVRNSVKTVIFGLIYQQGDEGLAANSGNTVKEIKSLTKKFLNRFPVGVKWFDRIKEYAKKHSYVESPLGRRRNLFGLWVPKSVKKQGGIVAAMLRRSVNSPVQGMASDFLICGARCLETAIYREYVKTGRYPGIHVCNTVHDSLEIFVDYKDILLAIRLIQYNLTTAVSKTMKQRHGLDFVIPLEIDFEIGSDMKNTFEWDYSLTSLRKIIKESLKNQKEIYKDETLNIKNAYKEIFNRKTFEQTTDWLKYQYDKEEKQ